MMPNCWPKDSAFDIQQCDDLPVARNQRSSATSMPACGRTATSGIAPASRRLQNPLDGSTTALWQPSPEAAPANSDLMTFPSMMAAFRSLTRRLQESAIRRLQGQSGRSTSAANSPYLLAHRPSVACNGHAVDGAIFDATRRRFPLATLGPSAPKPVRLLAQERQQGCDRGSAKTAFLLCLRLSAGRRRCLGLLTQFTEWHIWPLCRSSF